MTSRAAGDLAVRWGYGSDGVPLYVEVAVERADAICDGLAVCLCARLGVTELLCAEVKHAEQLCSPPGAEEP